MENKTLLKMRLERKQAQLEAAYNAYTALLKGGVQSYTIGSRSLTRLDLPSLEETIAKLEQNVQKIQSVTTLLEQGHTPESLLEQVLEGFDIEINDTIPTEFYCNCDKNRVEKALISIGRKELNELIQEGKEVELNCHFCNTNYVFSVEELKEILRKCK